VNAGFNLGAFILRQSHRHNGRISRREQVLDVRAAGLQIQPELILFLVRQQPALPFPPPPARVRRRFAQPLDDESMHLVIVGSLRRFTFGRVHWLNE
jgi:hypothetical protein